MVVWLCIKWTCVSANEPSMIACYSEFFVARVFFFYYLLVKCSFFLSFCNTFNDDPFHHLSAQKKYYSFTKCDVLIANAMYIQIKCKYVSVFCAVYRFNSVNFFFHLKYSRKTKQQQHTKRMAKIILCTSIWACVLVCKCVNVCIMMCCVWCVWWVSMWMKFNVSFFLAAWHSLLCNYTRSQWKIILWLRYIQTNGTYRQNVIFYSFHSLCTSLVVCCLLYTHT